MTSLPLDTLRLVVGGLLLVFGLQWLRKAILRGAGLMAQHDEEEIFREETAAARAAGSPHEGLDGYSFTIAFKGVLLEGLEVVFIALTFGANQHRVGLAAAAAAAAVLLVTAIGIAIHAPLARAPENAMKFSVGVMLTSFGIFWGAEGAGAHWPGGDAALLVDRADRARVLASLVALFRRQPSGWSGGPGVKRIREALLGVWEFVAGDDWVTAAGVVLSLGLTALISEGSAGWFVMPIAVALLLTLSIWREARKRDRG